MPLGSRPHKRRRRLGDAIELLLALFAADCRGARDTLRLINSIPVECARSRETVQRSALREAADYGWGAFRSRFFWGFQLHLLAAPDGTPRAIELASPNVDEREVSLAPLARCRRRGGETLIADMGCTGREFPAAIAAPDAVVARPAKVDEPDNGIHLAPIRQRIESIIWSLKGTPGLERHGARTMAGLRERVPSRLLCLAACISLNRRLGPPSRSLVSYRALGYGRGTNHLVRPRGRRR